MATRSGPAAGDLSIAEIKEFAAFPAATQRYIRRSLDIGLDRRGLEAAIRETLAANDMHDGVHLRLMVTRGPKRTPYQDPRASAGPATIVIIPEHKQAKPELVARGLKLFTVHVRRGYPDVQDPRWNSHSKLNCITACIQATQAGADEALMLDPHGFVATCNSTHFFIVRRGEVWTSTGDYCLHGVTRANVLRACAEEGITALNENRYLCLALGYAPEFPLAAALRAELRLWLLRSALGSCPPEPGVPV